ncbi:MAG TPA: cytochrome c peroxidase, partial [Candidatus Deferrimicrobiaceae bacterium]
LSDPANTNSTVLRDTNDVVASQGVFRADFAGIDPLSMHDVGAPVPDPVFHVNGINTRRVEPRNTPTVVNAAFNVANFWDGRANFYFNGVNPFGPMDRTSGIYENVGGVLTQKTVRIPLASLASQAVGPPLSENEMSFVGRAFPDVGRKLIPRQPLAYQLVHPQDGVLGPLSRATLNPDGTAGGLPGLSTTYDNLVRTAFAPQYWDSTQSIGGYTQMEANFSLFFGLAVQLYEETLQSDQAPFDRFMDGDDRALTDKQLHGFEIFLDKGGCAACHKGPTLSDASVQVVGIGPPTQPVVSNNIVELMEMNDAQLSIYDGAFHNIGVRPSNPVGAAPSEDPGRGETAPFVNPLTGREYPHSFSHLAVLKALGLLPADVAALTPTLDPRFTPDIRVAANGEFKTPSLRNAELTGPYFHIGGQSSLRQVVDFYDRGGDFLAFNDPDSDPLAPFIGFTPAEEEALVAFLLSLTDPRVRLEKAPFDHPQILVPDGHPGDRNQITCVDPQAPFKACDTLRDVPAVGAFGRLAAGLGPLPTFLGLEQSPLDVGLSESLRSPQPVGTPSVTFTAVPVGGTGSYEFRFLLDNVVVQPYGSDAAWTWST